MKAGRLRGMEAGEPLAMFIVRLFNWTAIIAIEERGDR